MAIIFSCDGCGKTGGDFVERGIVFKVHYCATCQERGDSYLKELNEIRTNLVGKFNEAKVVLIARYAINGFKLPDEPAV